MEVPIFSLAATEGGREGGHIFFHPVPIAFFHPWLWEKGTRKTFLPPPFASAGCRNCKRPCSNAGEKAAFKARKKREIESPSFRPRLSYHPKRGERRERGGCCNKSGAGKWEGHAVSPLFYRDQSAAVPSLNVRPSISFVEFFRHRVRGLA